VTDASTIRLVVSDVDGTLVDGKKQLTPAVKAAVARLTQAGVAFTIVSARPRSGMLPIADALGIDAPMGAFNGGIVFTRDGQMQSHHVIDRTVAEGMFAIAKGAAVDTWVFADDIWYASTDQGEHVANERLASNQAPIVTQDFTPYFDRADKITFVSDDGDLLKSLAEKANQFAKQATIVQSQTYYLDVTAQAANKGDGVIALSHALGVPLSETAVFGDQANDLPMFAQAHVSYAMGQGPAAVRAKATHVVASNDQDGVAEAIGLVLGGA
jgi:Cof subfamily protein (haloacid dehalogenase superfamily)